MNPIDQDKLTENSLFNGDLTIFQYKDGYRFSIDAILLAQFLEPKKNFKILDIGSGCGVVSLVIYYRWKNKNINISSLEIQPELNSLTEKNIEVNSYSENVSAINGDIREFKKYFPLESFDQIVANPPFYSLGKGRKSDNEQALNARHQVAGGLEDYLLATSKLLKNRAKAVFVYPAEFLNDFICLARKVNLEPKKIQFVYNYPEGVKDSSLFIIVCQKNGGVNLSVMPPLYVYDKKNGAYSTEVDGFYKANL
ncbi:MAG: methyltransferase [Desulfotalea sp.]